jgi:hypothetical protein
VELKAAPGWFNRDIQEWYLLHQRAYTLVEAVAVYLANFQAMHSQQATNRSLNLEKRRHNLTTCLQDGANLLCLNRLHMHWPVMADTHHLGDAARIVSVGFHRPGVQETLRVALPDADGFADGGHEMSVQPFRKRTGDPGSLSTFPCQTSWPSRSSTQTAVF